MPDPTPCPATAHTPPIVVLDTNVLLDLLLFNDARALPLLAALHGGQLAAWTTQAMLDELSDVLTRPFAQGWAVAADSVAGQARALCRLVTADDLDARCAGPAPRCSDPDDQKFIDLAWNWPAAWLISRDRALLALARPALARGLRIATPEVWAQATAAVQPPPTPGT